MPGNVNGSAEIPVSMKRAVSPLRILVACIAFDAV